MTQISQSLTLLPKREESLNFLDSLRRVPKSKRKLLEIFGGRGYHVPTDEAIRVSPIAFLHRDGIPMGSLVREFKVRDRIRLEQKKLSSLFLKDPTLSVLPFITFDPMDRNFRGFIRPFLSFRGLREYAYSGYGHRFDVLRKNLNEIKRLLAEKEIPSTEVIC
jgi:hypothetical protein